MDDKRRQVIEDEERLRHETRARLRREQWLARWHKVRTPLIFVVVLALGIPVAQSIYSSATGPSSAESQWHKGIGKFFASAEQTVTEVELWGSNANDISSQAFRPTFNAALDDLASCSDGLERLGTPPSDKLQKVHDTAAEACQHYEAAVASLHTALDEVDQGQGSKFEFTSATNELNEGDTLLTKAEALSQGAAIAWAVPSSRQRELAATPDSAGSCGPIPPY